MVVSLKEADQKRIIRVAFVALLIDLLAFTVILPLFPRLLTYYQSKETGQQVKKNRKNGKPTRFEPVILSGNFTWLCSSRFRPIQTYSSYQQAAFCQSGLRG